MIFEDFIKNRKVIIGEKDIQKAKSLIKMAFNTLNAANSLSINDKTSSPALSMFYEALRETVEAMCLQKGYKVYSHEAFTYYLKKIDEEKIAESFDRFRKLRNGVNYYGKHVSPAITRQAKKEIKEITKDLYNKYLKNIISKKGA